MTAPPGRDAATQTGNLTDLRPRKRNRRAEADRHRMTRTPMHAQVARLSRVHGIDLEPWQVDSLATQINDHRPANRSALMTAAELNRAFHEALMRAPWYRKPRRSHYGPDWRVTS